MGKEPAYPNKVQRMTPETIRVTWSDGHLADYSVLYLRKCCPCAGCSVEVRKQTMSIVTPDAPARLEISKVTAMGNYALGFHFNDGHSTGIYSFEYLRDICPCPQCVKANNLG